MCALARPHMAGHVCGQPAAEKTPEQRSIASSQSGPPVEQGHLGGRVWEGVPLLFKCVWPDLSRKPKRTVRMMTASTACVGARWRQGLDIYRLLGSGHHPLCVCRTSRKVINSAAGLNSSVLPPAILRTPARGRKARPPTSYNFTRSEVTSRRQLLIAACCRLLG